MRKCFIYTKKFRVRYFYINKVFKVSPNKLKPKPCARKQMKTCILLLVHEAHKIPGVIALNASNQNHFNNVQVQTGFNPSREGKPQF